MTRAPLVTPKPDAPYARGDRTLHDTTLGWRFVNPRYEERYSRESMGETGENVAERWGISREDQDAFALESQRRWAAADGRGALRRRARRRAGELERDEHPRPETTAEKLARSSPPSAQGGTVTAGNASGLNDGAAALVIASEERARALGIEPLGRLRRLGGRGRRSRRDGDRAGPGRAQAARAHRASSVDEIDLVELNEAFASQSLAVIRELGLDPAKVNVNGGAIAIGHPLGMSGARLVVGLVHELRRRNGRVGLATLCIGVGQGQAALFSQGNGGVEAALRTAYIAPTRHLRGRHSVPLMRRLRTAALALAAVRRPRGDVRTHRGSCRTDGPHRPGQRGRRDDRDAHRHGQSRQRRDGLVVRVRHLHLVRVEDRDDCGRLGVRERAGRTRRSRASRLPRPTTTASSRRTPRAPRTAPTASSRRLRRPSS